MRRTCHEIRHHIDAHFCFHQEGPKGWQLQWSQHWEVGKVHPSTLFINLTPPYCWFNTRRTRRNPSEFWVAFSATFPIFNYIRVFNYSQDNVELICENFKSVNLRKCNKTIFVLHTNDMNLSLNELRGCGEDLLQKELSMFLGKPRVVK